MTQNYSALTGISAPTNLRPHTNKDYTNDVVYKHGLPRPMKWNYRLGKLNTVAMDATTPDTYQVTNNNRYVRSSKTVPLIALMMDRPGHSINTEISCNINDTKLEFDENLTTTDCCKARNALRLVRGPSTVLNKTDQKYYPTQQQYLRSRGMTLKQQSFHYANANTGARPARYPAATKDMPHAATAKNTIWRCIIYRGKRPRPEHKRGKLSSGIARFLHRRSFCGSGVGF